MEPSIFREYDIRGIVDTEFTIEETGDIARAITSYFLACDPKLSRIALGVDGRTHSPAIKNTVINAIRDMGIDVLDIGVCPTPVLYFTLFNSPATSGIMITASHNPKEYNGMKICFKQQSVWGGEIQKIRTISETKNWAHITSTRKGTVNSFDANTAYIDWLTTHFAHLKNKSVHTVIDCGNGATGAIIPDLVTRMNWRNVHLLYENVDGTFPHHEADPTVPHNMEDVKTFLETHPSYTLGVGFDGDGDRMNPMTHTGTLVPGDQLLALYSKHMLVQKPRAGVVFDIKSSLGLVELLKEWNAQDHISPSGHSLIKDAMLRHGALLAGELSCHFFFKDRYFGYDDGIYALLRLFEILDAEQKTLHDLLSAFPTKINSPEIRIQCEESQKTTIIDSVKKFFAAKKDADLITIDGIRAHMKYGWGLARASNTQAVICLRFESDTPDGLTHIKNDFYQALKPYFDETVLRKEIGTNSA